MSGPAAAELAIHATIVGAAFCYFIYAGAALSARFDAGGSLDGRLRGLYPGWLFRPPHARELLQKTPPVALDLSDIQWRGFREGLPQAAAAMVAFAVGSQAVRRVWPTALVRFSIAFGLAFAGVLHGASAVFPLALYCCGGVLMRATAGRDWGAAVIWAYCVGTLAVARLGDGFSFGGIAARIAFLDGYRGPLRWHISYNLAVLRMLSYGMDLRWARRATAGSGPVPSAMSGTTANSKLGDGSSQQTAGEADSSDSLKVRAATLLPPGSYGAAAYLAYVLYPPLYVAGPVLTFNGFASQLQRPRPIAAAQTALYAVRLLAAMLCMEVFTHTLYFNAIARFGLPRPDGDRGAPSPLEAGLTGFWVLAFVWLKFLIIWRFFRLAALAAGVDAPENMRRCFANNYDIEGFWRNWHASYNLWLVRYMYVPLGGNRRRALNAWLIFTFVALWHDVEWRLLVWAWLMSLLFTPELGIKWLAGRPRLAKARDAWWWRHMCAALAAFNITGLMAANLAGFVVGAAGLKPLLTDMLSRPAFVAATLTVFFSAAQLMFAVRHWEEERGGRRLCPVDVLAKRQ